MKRTALTRKTRLKAKSQLRPKKRWTPKRHGLKPIPESVRQAAFERSRGCCDWCGLELIGEFDAHHRLLRRRQDSDDSLANIVVVHRLCHGRIHDQPKNATELGFMVKSGFDPASIPVYLHVRGLAYLPTDTEWIAA